MNKYNEKELKKFIKRNKKEKNKRGGKTMSKNVGAAKRELLFSRIKGDKAITLVALIITIIILLILAGVSLSFVFNGGILDKAQSAVNEYQNASQKEQNLLDQIDKYIENELGDIANDEPKVPNVDENGLATENTTIVAKDDPSIQIVIPKGFAPAILKTGTTQSLPGENGAVKEIMPAEEWNNVTKEDINRGIVVVDNTITYDGGQSSGNVPDFNEYVWIPMPDSSKFARIAWTTPYGHNESGVWGNWNSKQLLSEVSAQYRWWEATTLKEYIDMVSSVSRNKGFYISRYEASQKDSTIAQSKREKNPWVNVTQTTAITVSNNMNESINSHLIYGIEWDSILQWLLDSNATIGSETSGDTKTITIDDIQSDSSTWGNYANSVGGAATNSGDLQSGGTNEYWKVNNIYNLAGNVWEWTQEKYSTGTDRVNRGGNYSSNADSNIVAFRNVGWEGWKDNYGRFQSQLLCVVLYSDSEN